MSQADSDELTGLVQRRLSEFNKLYLVIGPIHASRGSQVVKSVMKCFCFIFSPNKRDDPFRDELSHALATLWVAQLIGAVEG